MLSQITPASCYFSSGAPYYAAQPHHFLAMHHRLPLDGNPTVIRSEHGCTLMDLILMYGNLGKSRTKAYVTSSIPAERRQDLQSSVVSVIECPTYNGRSDVEQMMIGMPPS